MDSKISPEEREQAFKFCQDHLSGSWKTVKLEDLAISRLSGGMSNLLYHCAIVNPHIIDSLEAEESHEVLLRLYGPAHGDTEIQLEIFRKLAAENLGPKLHADFHGGRLEEYLHSSPLTNEEMTRHDISAVIASKLASVHKLQFECLDKKPNWILDMFSRYRDFIVNLRNQQHHNQELTSSPSLNFQPDAMPTTREIANQLFEIDFDADIEFLANLFKSVKSPFVFSHNDLHQNNIIMLQKFNASDEKNAESMDLSDRIVLIDFEYSSYNYRTFDLANHLVEWCFDYSEDKYPFFKCLKENFPSDERQRQFLRSYVGLEPNHSPNPTHNRKLNGSYSNNSSLAQPVIDSDQNDHEMQNDENDLVEQLFNEMQLFLMASNLLWSLWAIYSACTSKINFGYWEMAKSKYEIYLLCKDKFNKRYGDRVKCGRDLKVQSSKM